MRIRIIFAAAIITMAGCSSEPEVKTPPAPIVAAPAPDTNGTMFTFETGTKAPVNGEHIQRHKNGVIEIRGMMKDGKREGIWKSWYEDGSRWSETTFKEGKKEGKTTTWYDNEQKRYEGYYKDNKESGKWKFWNESGQLTHEQDFGN